MNIIGIGKAGCGVAEQFLQFPQYKIFFLDTKNKKVQTIFIYQKIFI